MSSVIKVENLGKRYILNHREKSRFPTLRDEIVQKAQGVGRRLLHPLRTSSVSLEGAAGMEEFWALKDVSFEVKQGDRVGIIGRNGAGKSTLLKILSRITEPTTGRVSIKGRVASLLEVGTGFHPELTGRENIYLNGAILGMGKFEIRRKFDEIVDFAEVEKFLDTPVKRYSSGMYVRLAFAVAAHLEPEILIIDEVLAVGDAQFQQKCLGKMEEVGKEGRTVLFVSHNMAAVRSLCSNGILLKRGEVLGIGLSHEMVDLYMSTINLNLTGEKLSRNEHEYKKAFIADIYFVDKKNCRVETLITGDSYKIVIEYKTIVNINNPLFKVSIYNSYGQLVTHLNNLLCNYMPSIGKGNGKIRCSIKSFPLSKGNYSINASLNMDQEIDHLDSCLFFQVENGDYFLSGRIYDGPNEICLVDQEWNLC